MQSWHQLELKRRRYYAIGNAMFRRVFNNIAKDFAQSVIEIGDPKTALNTLSKKTIETSITEAYENIYVLVGVRFAGDAVADVQGKGRNIRLKSDPTILQGEWTRYMLYFVKEKCGEKIGSVTQTMYEGIIRATQKVVTEGIPEGWGPARVAAGIMKEMEGITRWKAEQIARTEVVGASNAGSYKGGGSFETKVRKVWLVNQDSETREDHAMMNGAPHIKYDESWQVGPDSMLHPHDPDASAGNVINCRCGITYEPENDIVEDLLSGRYDPENVNIY